MKINDKECVYVEELLKEYLNTNLEDGYKNTQEDWDYLEQYFNCKFDEYFKAFMDLMSKYSFEGDILGISEKGDTDSIIYVYNHELEFQEGVWDTDLIPFHSIGNGDYECISIRRCPNSPVYYVSHEDNEKEEVSKSFQGWVKDSLRDN